MSEREQRRTEQPPAPADDGASAGNLDGVRISAEHLLRAGDHAIARALSGNTERFLREARQAGGQ